MSDVLRHPCNLAELIELEVLAHETGLRHQSLLIEWNYRKVRNVVQSPPPVIPKISAERYCNNLAREIMLLRKAREQSHE